MKKQPVARTLNSCRTHKCPTASFLATGGFKFFHGLQACCCCCILLSMVKLLLKGEVGFCALNNHGNYIADLGNS